MLKKHLFFVVAVAAIGLMLVLGALKVMTGVRGADAGGGAFARGGPGGPGGRGPRGVSVTPAVIQVRNFTDTVEVLGVAKALQSITLTAPASQLVTSINFQSGQYVRKGQVLAELNAREQDAAILQSRSQVALAKSNWDRWQQLADKGLAPAATAEQQKAQYDQAVANLQASLARGGDRVIRAPFSGYIGLSDAAPGMLLSAGGAIATLDDLSVIRVDFPVPEQFISLLKDGLPIQATADAYPNTTFQGRIAQLDTRLDPATRAITARAEFPNPQGRLRPGMLLRVRIEQANRQNPAAPESAVIFEGGDAFVMAIMPAPPGQPGAGAGAQRRPASGPPPGAGPAAGPGGPGAGQGPRLVAVRRTVQTGIQQNGWVEILAGLKAGERIVADGTNRVRPNDPVSIGGAGQQGAGQRAPAPGAPRLNAS